MNQCTGEPAEQCLKRYIQGTLPESEAQQFEQHYLDCPVCLAEVEAKRAVRTSFRRLPADQVPTSVTPGKKRTGLISRPVAVASLVALALSLAIVYVGERFLLPFVIPSNVSVQIGTQPVTKSEPTSNQPPSFARPSSSVTQLADLALPPFRATTLHREADDADFASSMKAYSAGDCHTALTELARVNASTSAGPAARFYSALCQMHLGDLPAAASTLQRVAAAGKSPLQEAALYYLAQIALARDDPPSARLNLDRTIALHGDFEQRARRQSAVLAAATTK